MARTDPTDGGRMRPPKKLRVLALGGAGGKLAAAATAACGDRALFTVADADEAALARFPGPAIALSPGAESVAVIGDAFDDAGVVLLVAGLGGATGAGRLPEFAQLARARGLLTVAFVTTPFGFEGRARLAAARDSLARIEPAVDALIVAANQELAERAGEGLAFIDALRLADDEFLASVRALADIAAGEGLIGADLTALAEALRGAGRIAVLHGAADGADRAEHAVAALARSGAPLAEARHVFAHLTAASGLAFREVDAIARALADAAHPDADIRIAVGEDGAADGELRIAVLASGFVERGEAATVRPARPAKPTVAPAPRPAPPRPAADTHAQPVVVGIAGACIGTGKSTIARHLARQADPDRSESVVLIEVLPAGAQALAGAARVGQIAGIPVVRSSADRLAADVTQLRRGDLAYIFVDSSPETGRDLEAAIAVSDLVVVPAGPDEEQLEHVGRAVALAEKHDRPFVMVINRAGKDEDATARIALALAQHGAVCPVIVPESAAIAAAHEQGRTVTDTEPESKEAECMARLWRYLAERIGARTGAAPKPRAAEGAPEDRRRFRRWELDWPAQVTVGDAVLDTKLHNVSGGGALIDAVGAIADGDAVAIEILGLGRFDCEAVRVQGGLIGLRFRLESARQMTLAARLSSLIERGKTQARRAASGPAPALAPLAQAIRRPRPVPPQGA
jgi:cell division protein FtsZ